MQSQNLELSDYLPTDWQLCPTMRGLRLVAPNGEDAKLFFAGAEKFLKQSASHLKATIELFWEGCAEPLRVEGAMPLEQPQVNSYGASRLSVDASYEAIEDFIRGQRAAGKIVTVMSMNDRNPAKNDLFLAVNDLQIQHRAGGWKMNDWIGTNAKSTVWVRSFDGTLPKVNSREAGHNYYQELIRRIKAGEHFIEGFEYLIDRPNNAGLWLDVTDYHFAANYGGTAIRIAVSAPQHSTLIEHYEAAS